MSAENSVDAPPANIFSIFTQAWCKMSATGGRWPHTSLQLKHQRNMMEVWCSLYPSVPNLFMSIITDRMRAYSGSDIFCRFMKKSLLRIVDADKMLPEWLVTMFMTLSGSAMPSARSTRFSGFRASIPSVNSSFSNVLITNNTNRYKNSWVQNLLFTW